MEPTAASNPNSTARAYPWDYKQAVFEQIAACNRAFTYGSDDECRESVANLKRLARAWLVGKRGEETFVEECARPVPTVTVLDAPEDYDDSVEQQEVVDREGLGDWYEAILTALSRAGFFEYERRQSTVPMVQVKATR